jgi:hypothetical protein
LDRDSISYNAAKRGLLKLWTPCGENWQRSNCTRN